MGRAVVIGAGNAWRRDDGVGRRVAQCLRGRVPAAVDVVEHSGEASELLEAWRGAELAVVVDAVASGAAPGTVHRLRPDREPLPAELGASTHGFGVAYAFELGRRLGRLPAALVVYGVEGRDFGYGDTLTPEVEQAAAAVAEEILRELRMRV